jgi:hypothetical protein
MRQTWKTKQISRQAEPELTGLPTPPVSDTTDAADLVARITELLGG